MTDNTAATVAQLLSLRTVSGLGDKRVYELITETDGIEAVFEGPFETFEDFHYVDHQTYEAIQNLDTDIRLYRERVHNALADGIDVVSIFDDRYPSQLRHHHAPLVLFASGDTALLSSLEKSISFAGSRSADDRAIEWTRETSAALADAGYVIVSGGAFGIDTAAHEGALDANQPTISIQAGGLDNLYPSANENLFQRISSNGLLLSEKLPDEEPSRHDFLERNKTNSALSQAIVIGAAEPSGGTMSQYQDAKKQGTTVFVPTTAFDYEPTAGIEEILEDGPASSVSSAAEILDTLGLEDTREQTTLKNWDR